MLIRVSAETNALNIHEIKIHVNMLVNQLICKCPIFGMRLFFL